MGGYSFTSTSYYAESPSARSPVGMDGMVTHGDVDALTCRLATLHRHRCPCGRLASLAGALPGELLSVVVSGAAPSVRAATGLKPEVLAGRNEMCVVLVLVLPPAASRVEVACGYAPPVDVDLKAG